MMIPLVSIVSAMIPNLIKNPLRVKMIGVPDNFVCRDIMYFTSDINSYGKKACGYQKYPISCYGKIPCIAPHSRSRPKEYRLEKFTHKDFKHLMISINENPTDGE